MPRWTEPDNRQSTRRNVNHCVCALLLMIAVSMSAHADCQPGKDFRKTKAKTGGIEVVDVSLSGATTLDSKVLAKISNAMIGSCFDGKDTRFDERIYSLFRQAGYVSAQIQDLRIETVSAAIEPASVRVTGNIIEGQRCPTDRKGLHQFLLDHRSDSLEADPTCVDAAFASLGFAARLEHKSVYTQAMVDLLDFERNVENDYKMTTLNSQYPATDYLAFPAAVPYLVEAIKQSDSDLVRTNAAYTLRLIYQSCVPAAAGRLNLEAAQEGVTSGQSARLRAAAEYVNYLYSEPGPCKSIRGEATTVDKMERELFVQPQ